MGVFFDIISFSAWNILWGVLISAVCITLFIVVLKGWFKNAELSAWTYVVGVVLFVLIAVQSTMTAGATKIISISDDMKQQLTEIVRHESQNRASGLNFGSMVESIVSGEGLGDFRRDR